MAGDAAIGPSAQFARDSEGMLAALSRMRARGMLQRYIAGREASSPSTSQQSSSAAPTLILEYQTIAQRGLTEDEGKRGKTT